MTKLDFTVIAEAVKNIINNYYSKELEEEANVFKGLLEEVPGVQNDLIRLEVARYFLALKLFIFYTAMNVLENYPEVHYHLDFRTLRGYYYYDAKDCLSPTPVSNIFTTMVGDGSNNFVVPIQGFRKLVTISSLDGKSRKFARNEICGLCSVYGLRPYKDYYSIFNHSVIDFFMENLDPNIFSIEIKGVFLSIHRNDANRIPVNSSLDKD